jgi:hypothetical protein
MAATDTFTWNAGTSTWNTSSNWTHVDGGSFGTGSGANNFLFVLGSGLGSPYTVTLSTTNVTAGAVDITSANATLSIGSGQTLRAGAPAATEAGGTFTMTAGQVVLTNGTLQDIDFTINGGTLKGSGVLTLPAVTGGTLAVGSGGDLRATGGTLELLGGSNSDILNVASGSTLSIAGSGTLEIGNFVSLSSDTVNYRGAAGTLQLGNSVPDNFTNSGTTNTFNGTLQNLEVGTTVGSSSGASVIDFVSNTVTLGAIAGSQIEVNVSGGSEYVWNTGSSLTGDHVNWASDGNGGTDIWIDTNPCYAAGTRILTERGEVAVEQLAEGDMVITLSGEARSLQPVRWIGQRRMNLRQHPQPNLVAPIRVRRHAFGTDMPSRDLLLSPDHCLFVEGKLIPAKLLINDLTIVQERDIAAVHYYHVELDRHAVLFAEGLPAESYLDTGNRAMFANAGLALVLHPEFEVNAHLKCWETDACAPLAVSREVVKPIWDRLAERAESLGYQRADFATTTDPELRLVADGRVIWPVSNDANRYVFALPAGVSSVRLTSRASVPSHFEAYVDDWRHLGVAVRRIVVRDSAGLTEIPPDHPGLTQGWHKVERDAATMWRWMNGDAVLPIPPTASPTMVEVLVGITMKHVVEEGAEGRLAA